MGEEEWAKKKNKMKGDQRMPTGRVGGDPSGRKHVQIIWKECYGSGYKNSKMLGKEKTEKDNELSCNWTGKSFCFCFNDVFASNLL